MDPIRNAINNVYKEGKFSNEKQAETFQKIKPKRKQFIIPLVVTVIVTGCLLIGLNILLSQDSIESIFHQTSTTSTESYPEFSGKVKDYTVLKQPWMIVGIVVIVITFFYGIFALTKKWLWQLLLSVIIIIAVLGNMSEHIGYRYYVKNDADILRSLDWGIYSFGGSKDTQFNDAITINQYRLAYFTRGELQGVAIFKNDGKGYAIDFFIQSETDLMSAVHLKDVRQLIIPLLEGHEIEKLLIQMDAQQIEVVVESNTAQLVAVPYEIEAGFSEISIQAVNHEDNVFELYGPSNIFTYPVILK
ncbi:hypothetical protein ACIQ2D_13755 [Lysinibacillus sp. NPDC097287]|uniref:hypothetical protein n=1 Tax=Lysinibacillus sp. NPDC097287 TaxID=3364144 RepID=UPI003812E4A2